MSLTGRFSSIYRDNRVLRRDFQPGTWGRDRTAGGEMVTWLRVKGSPGRGNWLIVLLPHLHGRPAPKVDVKRLSPTTARITLGKESEVLHLGTTARHQAAIERRGKLTVLLKAGYVPPVGETEIQAHQPRPRPRRQVVSPESCCVVGHGFSRGVWAPQRTQPVLTGLPGFA